MEGFIPNPKLRLLDQVSEVMRFKHYSIRTNEATGIGFGASSCFTENDIRGKWGLWRREAS